MKPPLPLIDQLGADSYLRERINPQRKDNFYLHLKDLLQALKSIQTTERLRILDFGSGGSPYQSLFPNAEYKRADIDGDPTLDYIISQEGTISCNSEEFDMVLSTQVLEHVAHPHRYLAECLRVLKPAGKLVLTTHGTFEDHGCPHDYHRWTADGLRLQLQDAGFNAIEVSKLTVGARALIFFAVNWGHLFTNTQSGCTKFIMQFLWKQIYRFRRIINAMADHAYGQLSLCPSGTADSSIYVALLAAGGKPAK